MTKSPVAKIYCFVDESGQDSQGKVFLVAVVIVEANQVDNLRTRIEAIEIDTGKGRLKWGRVPIQARKSYFESIKLAVKNRGHIYYASFHQTKEYVALTTYTLAQSILAYCKDAKLDSTIIIDGLKDKEKIRIASVIKNFNISYRKIRGSTDQSEPLLRLADSVAGLARDKEENQDYAQSIIVEMSRYGILSEVQK